MYQFLCVSLKHKKAPPKRGSWPETIHSHLGEQFLELHSPSICVPFVPIAGQEWLDLNELVDRDRFSRGVQDLRELFPKERPDARVSKLSCTNHPHVGAWEEGLEELENLLALLLSGELRVVLTLLVKESPDQCLTKAHDASLVVDTISLYHFKYLMSSSRL